MMLSSRVARRLHPRYAAPRTLRLLQPVNGHIYSNHVFFPAAQQVRHFDNPLRHPWIQQQFREAYTKQPISLAIALTVLDFPLILNQDTS